MLGMNLLRKILAKLSPRAKQINAMEYNLNLVVQEMFKDKSKLHTYRTEMGDLFFYDSVLLDERYIPDVIHDSETNPGGTYNFSDINFEAGDIAFDIGAHVGTVSIHLAKMHPAIKIYAFEPAKINFDNLCRNIELNGMTNITPINAAVTFDGRDLSFVVRATQSQTHHAVSSALHQRNDRTAITDIETIPSVSLQKFCAEQKITQIKLLKIDCEGSEYEILYNLDLLSKTTHIRGELHSSKEENQDLLNHLSHFKNLQSIRFEVNSAGTDTLVGHPYYPNFKNHALAVSAL
jgi:FkbM family methyltransferase